MKTTKHANLFACWMLLSFLAFSCETPLKQSSAYYVSDAEIAQIESLFVLVEEIKIEPGNVLYYDMVSDKQSGAIQLENIQMKPFALDNLSAQDSDFLSATKKYIVNCDLNGDGEVNWCAESVDGVGCRSLIQECMESAPLVKQCRTRVVCVPGRGE